MSRRVIKTNNGDVTLFEPPFTPEEQAIVDGSLYGTPRTIARLTATQRPQQETPQAQQEATSTSRPDGDGSQPVR